MAESRWTLHQPLGSEGLVSAIRVSGPPFKPGDRVEVGRVEEVPDRCAACTTPRLCWEDSECALAAAAVEDEPSSPAPVTGGEARRLYEWAVRWARLPDLAWDDLLEQDRERWRAKHRELEFGARRDTDA